jgi:hypothetical protein
LRLFSTVLNGLMRALRFSRSGGLTLSLAAVAGLSSGSRVAAQVMDVRSATPPAAGPTLEVLKTAQSGFEDFRRLHLPVYNDNSFTSRQCDEQVGRFCYWYDENTRTPPEEPTRIVEARARLITLLDSAASSNPTDRWVAGQRVRYLVESNRADDAVRAARECNASGWWCPALLGLAYHEAGRFPQADSAFDAALGIMDDRVRCEWRDLKMLVDDAQLRDYRALDCNRRPTLEHRIWWLARPMMSRAGNDARTEYYSRVVMSHLLQDAPSAHDLGFDTDERELVLRYGWPRAWTKASSSVAFGNRPSITGHEPTPAYPYLPAAGIVESPSLGDSTSFRGKGKGQVRARYAPAYARRLIALKHQLATFRRGDSALVAVVWTARGDTALERVASAGEGAHRDSALTAALVLTRGDEKDAVIVRAPKPAERGVLTATAKWAPMLVSAEVTAPGTRALARARYGLRPSTSASRVTMSDVLFFEPYDDMPTKLDEVLPRAYPTMELARGARVGLYWEAYGTDPRGEEIGVSITVAPAEGNESWLRRGLQALRLVREAKPVSVGVTDRAAAALGYAPRSVVVDLETLSPGRYVVQVELEVKGQPGVRAERAITIK